MDLVVFSGCSKIILLWREDERENENKYDESSDEVRLDNLANGGKLLNHAGEIRN